MSQAGGALARSPIVRVSTAPADDREATTLDAARTAAESVPVVETGPTGASALAPLVTCTRGDRTAFFARPDDEAIRSAVDALESGDLPTDGAAAVVSHDPDRPTLPRPESGPLSVGDRRVLGPCGWIDPVSPADHEFLDGGRDLDPVVDAGVRGRGRGDAATDDPVSDVWTTAREADGDPVVVVNANEVDDRSRADELLLAGAPLVVLDAAATVAERVDATDVVVLCTETADRLRERVERAVDDARDELAVRVQIAVGPDEFRAGEESMALEAMEGSDRIEARKRPPSTAEYGLHGRPTLVHTPRTFAQVYRALSRPDEFDPSTADPGTRLVTVSGDVAAPATVELPTDGSLETVRDAVDVEGRLDVAVVGGRFGGVTDDLDVSPAGPSLAAAGLGTNGAVELLNEETCVVAEVGSRARFARDENCGRCVPCREGSKQLVEMLRDVYGGDYDADGLRELARVVRRSSTCDFGVGAARPVLTAVDRFEPTFRAHANGRCPSGTCDL